MHNSPQKIDNYADSVSMAEEFSNLINQIEKVKQDIVTLSGIGNEMVELLSNAAASIHLFLEQMELKADKETTEKSISDLSLQLDTITQGKIDGFLYIGDTEPTDENVKIWIQPTDNSTNNGSSGGAIVDEGAVRAIIKQYVLDNSVDISSL